MQYFLSYTISALNVFYQKKKKKKEKKREKDRHNVIFHKSLLHGGKKPKKLQKPIHLQQRKGNEKQTEQSSQNRRSCSTRNVPHSFQ